MHLHIAFGGFVLIDLQLDSSLFKLRGPEEEEAEEEAPAAPLGFQPPGG